MKFKIFKFNKVTSTNDKAINLITKKNKISGCVCAYIQTKGRGTYGKKWISKKGNFFGSIFFPLKINYPTFDEFSTINSIIIYNVIKKFYKKKNISLKFPNDILINKKKICGILQEVITLQERKFLIVGIGLNTISSPKLNKKYLATNILHETKTNPGIKEIIKQITHSYEKFFLNLRSYDYLSFKKKAKMLASN
jgi:BirA family biotin operon repressor/biotin-[acetyl-CoA-carboxylase] ligase|tara:strand:- start:176 stop:760 length:585 start_codon:yes stop_codon:yes gene_type:complete